MVTNKIDPARFDHFDPILKEDPYPIYKQLRDECPVAHSDAHGGFWVLTRYADIYDALRDPEVFSSFPNGVPASPNKVRPVIPLELDPPEHAKYRQLLAPLFSPNAAREMETVVRQTAVNLISQFDKRGHCDLAGEFAGPLPTRIFTAQMGLPIELADQFFEWEEAIIRPPKENAVEARAAASKAVYDYLEGLLESRRSEAPRDDLIGALMVAQIDDRPLRDEELLEICWLLFEAGLDTVASGLEHALALLAVRPDLQERVRREPEIIPGAIEELLRWNSHVSMGRTLKCDHEFRGVQMHAGDRVLVLPGAADRDERQFPDPETIDFDRADKRHMAFGAGPHRCLGSHLARLELRVALEEIHRRIGPYRVADGEQIERSDPGFVRSLVRLPVQFDVL